MSNPNNPNRPTVIGAAGETPGETPRGPGASAYTEQAPRTNEYGAIQAERRRGEQEALERERIAAENAAAYTQRKAREVSEDIDQFLNEAKKLYDSLNAMEKKMKKAVAVSERARNVTAERAATTALALDDSQEATERAIELVNKTNDMVEQFKRDTINYVAGVGNAQRAEIGTRLQEIDEKMKELNEKTKELAEKKDVDPELVEDLKKNNKQIQTIVTTPNTTQPQPLKRGKMGICFIKFEGYTNILNPYADDRKNSNIINPILPVNFNVNLEGMGDFSDVPAGNYLFVDNFKLKLSDFRNMNRSDFINLILNPKQFIEFLEKLEKSSVERQFVDFRKKGQLSKEERRINKENAKIYAAKLFAKEQDFNIVYPKKADGSGGFYFDYIIMTHELKKKSIEGPDAFRFHVKKEQLQNNDTKQGYTFFTFKIKLVLDSRERYEITPKDIKTVGCQQRKARIFKIMGSLKGTKQIITAIMGPEGAKKYLVDDTKIEELHGRAKPLPSKLERYKQEKSILDKLSFVSQVDRRDLPVSRNNQERALQRERLGQSSLSGSITRPKLEGGKKTKRILYQKNKSKKTKKEFYKKCQKYKNTKKIVKNKEKQRKTKKL